MIKQSRRFATFFAFIVLLLVGTSYINGPTLSLYGRRPTTAIITTETREPHVELDPSVLLSSWTLVTLSNYLYAQGIGAQYVYYKIDPPVTGDLPPAKYRPRYEGYCQHKEHGWRTAHFCKLPFVWWFMRTNRHVEDIVFIDSDAMFRQPEIHVNRHLDLLSPQRPFGVLTNHPYDNGANSGYWFMRRSAKVQKAFDVEDFVLQWWNEDWGDTIFQFFDQSTLRRLIGGNFFGANGTSPREKQYINEIVLLDEWAFKLKSPDQMILHMNHLEPDRDEQLAQAWVWNETYPLDDREKLAVLLKQVDIRRGSATAITEQMPLTVDL